MAGEKESESVVQVSYRFDGAEQSRVDAIVQSATRLVSHMLSTESSDDDLPPPVWHVREAVWPVLGMREFRGTQVRDVTLTLVPLSRIGQMEGKSGSLVLVGYFSAKPLGELHSHPLVIKTIMLAKSPKLHLEYSRARKIKPFVYDKKDRFAI